MFDGSVGTQSPVVGGQLDAGSLEVAVLHGGGGHGIGLEVRLHEAGEGQLLDAVHCGLLDYRPATHLLQA